MLWDLDWVNPILIKNLRQGLRGNYLRRSFLLALAVATVAGLIALISISGDDDERSGRVFFMFVYTALCGCVVGLLPLSAMITGDADAARRERLYLTPLPAGVIVRGRLLAALSQGAGVTLGLLPYLSMSLLLPGIDPLAIALCAGMTLTLSAALSALAVALSSFSSHRLFLAVTGAALAVLQLGAIFAAFAAADDVIDHPHWLQDRDRWFGFAVVWLLLVAATAFSLCLARLGASRPEENGVRNGRALALLVIPPVAALFWWEIHSRGYTSLRAVAEEIPMVLSLLFCLSIAPFVLDSRQLTPQLAARLPASPLRRLLLLPWLPGVGRGLLLTCAALTTGALIWWQLAEHFASVPTVITRQDPEWLEIWPSRYLDTCLRSAIFLLLPAPLLSRIPPRLSSLLALPALGLFWALMAGAAELIDDASDLFRYDNTLDLLTKGDGLLAVFLLALALNVPAMIRGVAELLEIPAEPPHA